MVAVDERDLVKFFGKYGMLKRDFYNMLLFMELPIWFIMVIGVLILPRGAGGVYTMFYMGVAGVCAAIVVTMLKRRIYLKDYNERVKGAAKTA